MRFLWCCLATATLACGVVGCGGGGIETGIPTKSQEMNPAHKQSMEEMGKQMLKGPKAFGK